MPLQSFLCVSNNLFAYPNHSPFHPVWADQPCWLLSTFVIVISKAPFPAPNPLLKKPTPRLASTRMAANSFDRDWIIEPFKSEQVQLTSPSPTITFLAIVSFSLFFVPVPLPAAPFYCPFPLSPLLASLSELSLLSFPNSIFPYHLAYPLPLPPNLPPVSLIR